MALRTLTALEARVLAVLVEKTGGPAEHEAFHLLHDFVTGAEGRPTVDPNGDRP